MLQILLVFPTTMNPPDPVVKVILISELEVYTVYQLPLKEIFIRKFIDILLKEGSLTLCSTHPGPEERDFFGINAEGQFFCNLDYKFLSNCMNLKRPRPRRYEDLTDEDPEEK